MQLKEVQKAVGNRLRELRTKKNLSQEGFADICGLHRSHMGEIERGKCNMELKTLLVTTQKLKTKISSLFKGIA